MPFGRVIAVVLLSSLLVFMWATPVGAQSGDGRYKLELTLNSDETRRPYVHEVILDRRGFQEFEFNKRAFLEKHYQAAQEALARRRGYIPEIYGKDFYKLVQVNSSYYKLTDLRHNRVVNEGSGRGTI